MRPSDELFDRLGAAIDGGNRFDMRVRELRACANVLEMHVTEEMPDLGVIDTIHTLLLKLAVLRRVPEARCAQIEAILQEVREFAFP
jgi:hypothetical protein